VLLLIGIAVISPLTALATLWVFHFPVARAAIAANNLIGGTLLSADNDLSGFGIGAASVSIPPPPGLVGWWPGDGNADDIAGGNHGTLQGGADFAPGMVGQAFRLDGLDDHVLIPHSAQLAFVLLIPLLSTCGYSELVLSQLGFGKWLRKRLRLLPSLRALTQQAQIPAIRELCMQDHRTLGMNSTSK